ncbi:MAG: A/G-specific adenine glycosylase [Verrucomicrobia bacterium]|nr:A/G-specific adenine glycosylase [Verrucomicrobiota bacterium]
MLSMIDALKNWFLQEKRDFPWRNNPTPYEVWISEVMLQQTQASVVVGYFHRWMKKFPTLSALARASQDEVMKAWEGLGYYSRARNLHAAAQLMQGKVPTERTQLEQLPGFGPYTVGAVLSFAHHQKAAAVDANVKRVISRLYASEEDITGKTESLLPEKQPWVVMEALIELGALVCQKKPRCHECPLQKECRAFKQGITDLFPSKKKMAPITKLERRVAVIGSRGAYLVRQEEVGKVMGGLFLFPYVEKKDDWDFPLEMKFITHLPPIEHGFTRYRAILFPEVWQAKNQQEVEGHRWVSKLEIKDLPFASGHRQILQKVLHASTAH